MMTVLITGASSGIGAGLAKSFAADGHLVIACGRDASRLAALQQLSPNISVRLFDMTDRDACRQALTGCFADLIILCAGTCEYLDHGQVDAALVERVMATNFLGPVNCLAALQTQLEAGDRVVLVSSMAHWLPFPRAEAYGASKAALISPQPLWQQDHLYGVQAVLRHHPVRHSNRSARLSPGHLGISHPGFRRPL